jgi:flagellar biosynthesis/type III secretory pathway chaperone
LRDPTLTRETFKKIESLCLLLDDEIAVIESGDMVKFEEILAAKESLLADISRMAAPLLGGGGSDEAEELPEEIALLHDKLAEAKTLHLRNARVVDRKIESTKAALEILKSGASQNAEATYDRMGQIRTGKGYGHQSSV